MKKVAIYQNTISRGGRIRVIAYMTECLNSMGIVPDWISFRNSFKESELESIHPVSLKATLKTIKSWNKGLSEYKYLKLNKIVLDRSSEYDLIINSNNVLSGITEGENYLHYVHFPREARLLPEYSNSVFNSAIMNRAVTKLYRPYLDSINMGFGIIANSKFTAMAISKAYSIEPNEIDVLYPPISITASQTISADRKKIDIISVGRFDENKNQLMQIEIAEMTPDIQYMICGFTPNKTSENYFKNCLEKIRRKRISNVTLKKNISSSELVELQQSASYFLHTMRDEPFGIATVEAIMNDCIPIVHNSGGSAEIVDQNQLVFNNSDEAVQKLNEIIQLDSDKRGITINHMKERIKQFDASRFKSAFTEKLEQILN